MSVYTLIETICLTVVIPAFFLNRWKSLDKINRNVRRVYFILLSMTCIYVAVSTSYESIERLANQPFAFRSVTRILAATGWWFISGGVVFRQLNFTKRLWK